jgi:hypothetical protein
VTLPTTAVLATCVYLPREVFFCFFGFAGAVGFFAAPGGFGLLGDTCPSFGFRESCRSRFYVAAGATSTAGAGTPNRAEAVGSSQWRREPGMGAGRRR